MPRLRPPPAPPRAHGVIVYLTQVRHSTYANKDSLGLLRGSLASLAKHYLEVHRDDTLLLHTGDFDEPSLQRLVLAPFTALPISFVRLPEKYWSLPPWLNETLGPVAPQMRLGKWVDNPFFSVVKVTKGAWRFGVPPKRPRGPRKTEAPFPQNIEFLKKSQ